MVRGILLDIEGTTSSIRFVYDVMFPYVRNNLANFLKTNWNTSECQACLPLIASDIDANADWLEALDLPDQQQKVFDAVVGMMDNDVKATGLKQLQGLIWKAGFESGEMIAHLYDDVPQAIESWKESGLEIRIYSSGSIGAQKLFFGHTGVGNLLNQFEGHYDTTTGSKRETQSYENIASDYRCPAGEVLFVSDVVEELDAAKAAGLQTALSLRPGNKPVADGHGHREIKSFNELLL